MTVASGNFIRSAERPSEWWRSRHDEDPRAALGNERAIQPARAADVLVDDLDGLKRLAELDRPFDRREEVIAIRRRLRAQVPVLAIRSPPRPPPSWRCASIAASGFVPGET